MTGLSPSRIEAISALLLRAGCAVGLSKAKAGLELTVILGGSRRCPVSVRLSETGDVEFRVRIGSWATAEQVVHAVRQVASGLERLSPLGEPLQAGRTIGSVAGYDDPVTDSAGDSCMAGVRDGLVDESRAHETPRINDTGHMPDVGTDFRDRLDRLPRGHPSSPREADGTPKPPVPDPGDRALPLPGDPDTDSLIQAGTEAADDPKEAGRSPDYLPRTATELADGETRPNAELAPAEEPVVKPDGTWEWKGRTLSPENSRIADEALDRFRAAEGRDEDGNYGDRGLTPAMRRIEAQLDHGHLVEDTEKFALKSPDRFKEKIAKLISDEPDASVDEIIGRINDSIRYTFIFREEEYTSGVSEIGRTLADSGFDLYERKNSWVDDTKSYQGVNSSWRNGTTGSLFEVQMHTEASWKAKQESHRLYEIIESPVSTPEEKRSASEQQDTIFARVPIPPGVARIASFRKEGW